MTARPQPAAPRTAALVVLALALAATAFGVWREHKIAAQNRHIRMQDGLAQLQPQLGLGGHAEQALDDFGLDGHQQEIGRAHV